MKTKYLASKSCKGVSLVGETREVWAGFVKRQFSSSGQWLDLVFHSLYVKLPFACKCA